MKTVQYVVINTAHPKYGMIIDSSEVVYYFQTDIATTTSIIGKKVLGAVTINPIEEQNNMLTSAITSDLLDAIKVQFLQPIYEEDFVERGMKAWLTKVEWDQEDDCYNMYFDFGDFEKENAKYFTCCYHSNSRTNLITTDRREFTAIEAGYYEQKLKCNFYVPTISGDRNDELFAEEIKKYLKIVV